MSTAGLLREAGVVVFVAVLQRRARMKLSHENLLTFLIFAGKPPGRGWRDRGPAKQAVTPC